MDIVFPHDVAWVCPIVSAQRWPAGSESAWFRTAGYLRAAAQALEALTAEVGDLRGTELPAVLVGDTAQAADAALAMLVQGDSSLAAIGVALRKLGVAAADLGTEVQTTKLEIYTALAIAAATIVSLVANASESLGASLAQIPVVRWLVENAITRLVSAALERIGVVLADMLGETVLARLALTGVRLGVDGALMAGLGAGQESLVQGIEVALGHDSFHVGKIGESALSMGVAGVAGGGVGLGVGSALGKVVGEADGLVARALRGAITGLASAEAANLAGGLVGGNVNEDTFLGGALGFLHGGVHGGLGEHNTPAEHSTPSSVDQGRPRHLQNRPDGGSPRADEPHGAPLPRSPGAGDLAARSLHASPAEEHAVSANDGVSRTNPSRVIVADRGARPSEGSSATRSGPQGDSPPPRPRGTDGSSARIDTAPMTANRGTGDLHSPHDQTSPSGHTRPQEGQLNLSTNTPDDHATPTTDGPSPAGSDLVGQSGVVGPPDMPRAAAPDPSLTPAATSERGLNVGPPTPIPDARAGLAEPSSAAGESAPQPAGAAAARTSDTTATRAGPGTQHGDVERVEAEQTGDTGVQRAAPVGRSGAEASVVDRGEGRRPADRPTKRQDPSTRPRVNGRDPSGPPGRPPMLHRRGSDGHTTPNPDTAGGGAGDDRGGDGGHRGGASGGGGDGERGPGEGGGDDFVHQQAAYRAQDRTTRRVDTRYAELLGDVLKVLKNGSDTATVRRQLRRLAEDLSGVYGPYRIRFEGDEVGGELFLTGKILNGDTEIGRILRRFDHDKAGNIVAYHVGLVIDDESLRGRGFSKALASELERFYERCGVDRIEASTHGQGSYAAAHRGYVWHPDPQRLQESLDRVKDSAHQLRDRISDDARPVVDQIVQRLNPKHPRLPELIDLADLETPDEPELGRRLLDGVLFQLHTVKYLRTRPLPQGGFRAWLRRWFGQRGNSARE